MQAIGNDNNRTHPIFGDLPVVTAWVYRLLRDKNGAEVKRCVLAGAPAIEFVSEGQVLASWGPGRFRIIGRDSNNRICGVQHIVEFEDASGRVPMNADDEPSLSGASGPNGSATIQHPDKSFADRAIELMKLENAAAEKRQEREAAHYSNMSSELIKVLKADGGNGGETLIVTILRDRIKTLEDDCRELRTKNDALRDENTRQKIKIETVDLQFSTVAVRALEPHAGTLVNALAMLGMSLLPESKKKALEGAMQHQAAQLEAPKQAAPTTELQGMKVPTVASIKRILDAGHAIPGEILTFCQQLHKQGLLPADVWQLVQPFVDLAVAAANS